MDNYNATYILQGLSTGLIFILCAVAFLYYLPSELPGWIWPLLEASTWCIFPRFFNLGRGAFRGRGQQSAPDEIPVEEKSGGPYPAILSWVFDRRLTITNASSTGLVRRANTANRLVGENAQALEQFSPRALADMRLALTGKAFFADYDHGDQQFRTQYFPVRSFFGVVTRCVCTTVNLSHIRMMDSELALSRKIIEQASDAIVVMDDRRVVISANQRFCEITGFETREVVGNKGGNILKADFRVLKSGVRQLMDTGNWNGEISARRKSGELYVAKSSVSLIRERGRITHYLVCFSDISRLKQEHNELHHLANHDFLTGLPNRRLFLDRLGQAIKRAKRQQKRFAIYFLDLNDFKEINDTHGHRFGDELLCQAAGRLLETTREMDTVARLAGDEFIVLVEQVRHDGEIIEIGKKILSCFEADFRHGSTGVTCSASLGVSVFPDDGESQDILMAIADTSMYRAKELEENYLYFHGNHYGLDGVGMCLEPIEITRAIAREEFELHYQPQIDLESDTIIACEVLVRWNHSAGQQLLPGQFLPLAEREELANGLGQWILKTAVSQFFRWTTAGICPGSLAINLAASQLRDDELLILVEDLVGLGLIKCEKLQFEVSLDTALEQGFLVEQFFRKASAMGISCALDEFGSREAGFEMLERLKIDVVKLDRSLIHASRGNQHARAVIAALGTLGNMKGFQVVGVGVEQHRQVENLNQSGCHLVQGYYYAPPLDVDDFARFYQSFNRQTAS